MVTYKIYGGSGLRGLWLRELCVREGEGVCVRVGKGCSMEQLLAFKNNPSFSVASSDCRIAVSLHGRGKNLRLSLA